MDREARTRYDVLELERMLLDESAEPTQLPLALLEDITNCFALDHQIGRGGFAVVYKGMVGKAMVAVKKLSNTIGIHENKFHEEVKSLIKAKHKNIVRFLGYCADTQGKIEDYEGMFVMADQRNWLLCFEYVCNGSLDKHITDTSCGLEWRKHYQIIKGICEGLLFLHEKRILHLDLKPANILLDHQMVPKIADFGLSRCLGEESARVITRNLCGTLGYMDPEYLRSGQITFASDIFSLGVIIMEILTGGKGYLEAENIVESWMNRLGEIEGDMQLEQVRVCTEIGIECMDFDPKKRPVAQHIIDRLGKLASADYSDETGINSSSVKLLVSLHGEQSGERIGKIAAECPQKADVEENSGVPKDVANSLGRVHFQEGQQKIGQLSLWGMQDTKQKGNRHSASISRYISTMFRKLNNLDFFNVKARRSFNQNRKSTLEKLHILKIFRKEELKPILQNRNFIGKGGLTEVYKGLVDNVLVAVKKPISGSVIENEQFEDEVIIQSQFNHRNVISFVGCCLLKI
uniref:Uncharacterized protein n=1 Tax=Avena sativa TaxID=4498 RepID=A0ACD5X6Q7_AVESA